MRDASDDVAVLRPAPYLSANELADVTPWTPKAIRRKVERGHFLLGVHYFQPGGPGTEMFFDFKAVCAFIRGDAVSGQRGYDVDQARRQANTLLG